MTKPLILVTGATGKTGTPVIDQLVERGYPVRAFVHRLADRSSHLSDLGAEVVVGDFHDLASVRGALKGVDRVYFCYPPQGERLLEAAAQDHRDGLVSGATNVVETITGRPPQSLAEFVRAHESAF